MEEMEEPNVGECLSYPPIDYQDICYYSAPKNKTNTQQLG